MVACLAAENKGTVVVGVEWLFKLGMLLHCARLPGLPRSRRESESV